SGASSGSPSELPIVKGPSGIWTISRPSSPTIVLYIEKSLGAVTATAWRSVLIEATNSRCCLDLYDSYTSPTIMRINDANTKMMDPISTPLFSIVPHRESNWRHLQRPPSRLRVFLRGLPLVLGPHVQQHGELHTQKSAHCG